MINWVKNLFGFPSTAPEQVGQGAQAFEKKARAKLKEEPQEEERLTDEEARRRSMALFSVTRKGGSEPVRFPLSMSVKNKAKKSIADFYDIPEIMEEITEKIQEAAEVDPFYKKLFR